MLRRDFEEVVRQALSELPPEFQDALDNLDVQVRWAPTPEERRRSRLRPGADLFGVYMGRPLTHRTHFDTMVPPDVIVIYQRAHELPATFAFTVESGATTVPLAAPPPGSPVPDCE